MKGEKRSEGGVETERRGIRFSVMALGPDYRGYAPHWSWLLRCLSEISLDRFPTEIFELMFFFTQEGVELKEPGKRKRKFRAFLHKDGQLVVSILMTDSEYDVNEEDYRAMLSEMVRTAAQLAAAKCGKDLPPEEAEAFHCQVAQGLECYNRLGLPLRFP